MTTIMVMLARMSARTHDMPVANGERFMVITPSPSPLKSIVKE